jgi:hypothetical protein
MQFPPFAKPPPELATKSQHTITLVYTGASPKAPPGTNSSQIEFDSFAIPEIQPIPTSNGYLTYQPVVLGVILQAITVILTLIFNYV